MVPDHVPTPVHAAYVAGLFEGEGCIQVHRAGHKKKHPSYSLCAVIQMCDIEPLRLLQWFWRGRLYEIAPKEADWRLINRWVVSGREAAAFLAAIQPYLQTQRMEAKVELALAFQAQKRRMGRGVTETYRERQAEFAVAIRKLNQVGSTALNEAEREAVLAALLDDQQEALVGV